TLDDALGEVGDLAADQRHLDLQVDRDLVAGAVLAVGLEQRPAAGLDRRALGLELERAAVGAVAAVLPHVDGAHLVGRLQHLLREAGDLHVDDPVDDDAQVAVAAVGLDHLEVTVPHGRELGDVAVRVVEHLPALGDGVLERVDLGHLHGRGVLSTTWRRGVTESPRQQAEVAGGRAGAAPEAGRGGWGVRCASRRATSATAGRRGGGPTTTACAPRCARWARTSSRSRRSTGSWSARGSGTRPAWRVARRG